MADFITIAKQTYTPSGSDTLVKFDLIFADATIGGSKISGAVIDLDYNYSVVTLSSATSPTYVDELGGTPNVWSNVVPNLSGATANGKIALTAAFDSFNPILGADQKALSVTLKVPGSTTSFPVTLQSGLGSENYITTENGVKHDLDGGALPSASETPTLTLQLADTTRMVDEDAHNTGRRIAFNGDTGTVNVESGTGSTAKNQLDLTATGITDFTGYTLSVSLDNYGSGDNILKLSLATGSGVFGVDATSGDVTYYESATYYGTDVYDGTALVHESGDPADEDQTGTVIGQLSSASGALTITLNSAATTEIVETLASHVKIRVVNSQGKATQNWLAVDDQVVTATFTLGNGTTTATDTRSIQFISQPDLLGDSIQLWGTVTNGTTLQLFDLASDGKPDLAELTNTWTDTSNQTVSDSETDNFAIVWDADNSGKWTAYRVEKVGLSGFDSGGRPTTLVLGPAANEIASITWETTVTNGVLGETSWTEEWTDTGPNNTTVTVNAAIALQFVDKQSAGAAGAGVFSIGDWVVGTETETVGNVAGQAKNFTFEVKGLTATDVTLQIVSSDFVGEDIITGMATFNGTTLTSMGWPVESGGGGGSTEATFGTVVKGPISGATVFRDMDGDFTWDTGETTATTNATGAFTLAGTGGVIVATGGTDTTTQNAFTGMLLAPSNATVVTPLTSLLVAGSQLSGGALTVTQLKTALGLGAIDPLTFNPFASGVDTAQALAAEKAAAQVYTVIATFTQALTTASGSASNAGKIMGVVAATLAGAIKPATSGTVVDLTNATTLSGILAAAESAVTTQGITLATPVPADTASTTATATGSIASAADLTAVADVLDKLQDSLSGVGNGGGQDTASGGGGGDTVDGGNDSPTLSLNGMPVTAKLAVEDFWDFAPPDALPADKIPEGATHVATVNYPDGKDHLFDTTGDGLPDVVFSKWFESGKEFTETGSIAINVSTKTLTLTWGSGNDVETETARLALDASGNIVGVYTPKDGMDTGNSGGALPTSGSYMMGDPKSGVVIFMIDLPSTVTALGSSGKVIMEADGGLFVQKFDITQLRLSNGYLELPVDTTQMPDGYIPNKIDVEISAGALTGVSGELEFSWRVKFSATGMPTLVDMSGENASTELGDDKYLEGTIGDDTLTGGDGDDFLLGGVGDDHLDGGKGSNDVAQYGEYSSKEWEVEREDNGSFTLTHKETGEQDVLTGIEKVWFNDGSKSLAASFSDTQDQQWGMNNAEGTSYDDVIDTDTMRSSTNNMKRDRINAGAGDDHIDAGEGGDEITGGEGNDTIDGGNDTSAARLAGTATNLWELENRAIYSGGSKRYTVEKATDDTAGTVTGVAGQSYYTVTDTRSGSPDGTDIVFNIDALQFTDKQVRLTPEIWIDREWVWNPSTGQSTQGDVRGVTVRGIDYDDTQGALPEDSVTGALFAGSDRLEGNDGDDKLYGGAGGDTLRGDKGNDTLDGGANKATSSDGPQTWDPNGRDGADVAEYNGKAERYTVTRNDDGSFTITDTKANADGEDTLTNIEVLRFNDSEKNLQVISRPQQYWNWDPSTNTNKPTISGYDWEGTDWADTIDAAAVETAAGKTWDDRIRDGAGDDTIKSGGGNDWIELAEGDDSVDAGEGNDTIHYDAAQRRFSISFTEDDNGDRTYTVTDKLPLEFGGMGTDTLANIESLQFSDGWKQLEVSYNANSGQNNINGTDFNDRIDSEALASAQTGGGLALLSGEPGSVAFTLLDAAKQPVTVVAGASYVAVLVSQNYSPSPVGNTATLPGGTTPTTSGSNTQNYQEVTRWVHDPQGGHYEPITLALIGSGVQLTGEYAGLNNIYQSNLALQVYATDGAGNKTGDALGTVAVTLSSSRDWIDAGTGDDRVLAGAGGDHIQDAAGNDFYDGGANGTSDNSWENNDQIQFSGARKRYTFDSMTYNELGTAVTAASAKAASARTASESRLIDLKTWIDANYNSTKDNLADLPANILEVTDKLPDASGGQGVNYIVNMERVQFQDDGFDLGVTINRWQRQQWDTGDWVGTNTFTGGILGDTLDARTYDSDNTWASKRDWMQGKEGDDSLYGGTGADQLEGGKGNDILDGGENPSLDSQNLGNTWDIYDEARFTNSIKRYDIQFFRPQDGGGYNDMGVAQTNGGYVKSGYYAANGFIVVADRYSDALGGEGRDVVRNVERLTFSDAWEDLSFSYQDNSYLRTEWKSFEFGGTSKTYAIKSGDFTAGQNITIVFYDWSQIQLLNNGVLVQPLMDADGSKTNSPGASYIDISTDALMNGQYTLNFTGNYSPWTEGFNIGRTVTNRWASGTRFGDKMIGLVDGENRFEGRAGDDYLKGGNLRDELEGGKGDDTIDGGANPAVDPTRPWETWDKFDVARYQGDRNEFKIKRLTDDASGTVTGTADQTYYEVKHLIPGKLGGLGTDIVFNVERIEFTGSTGTDRDIQLDVKVDSWTYQDENNQTVTSGFYKGTIFADSITGGSNRDEIEGNDGRDTIDAGAGDDHVRSGAGNDDITLGSGNDNANLGTGNDTVKGGADSDTVYYDDAFERYTVTVHRLSGGAEIAHIELGTVVEGTDVNGGGVYRSVLKDSSGATVTYDASTMYIQVVDSLANAYGGEGTDTLYDVEMVAFEGGALFLASTSMSVGSATISFNAGDFGRKPNEINAAGGGTNGTNGNDTLPGTTSNDWLQGWAGNDTLTGDAGDDQLNGGLGNDLLIGGTDNTSNKDSYWNAGDTAQYHGAVRERLVIESGYVGANYSFNATQQAETDVRAYRVTDIASLTDKTQTGENFNLAAANVNTSVGYGQDILVGIERIQIDNTELQLSPLTNTWGWDGSWWEGYWDQTRNEWVNNEWRYPVSRSFITGTFLDDTLMGGSGGDEIDGQAGNDIIDGGADTNGVTATKYVNGQATSETRSIAGNEWDMQDVVRYTGSRERYIVKGVLVKASDYSIIDPLFATGTELFGIQVTDVLSLIDGTQTDGQYNLATSNISGTIGTGQDLLVNVERVEFNGSQLSIKPQINQWTDQWSGKTQVNAQGTEFDDALGGKEGDDWLSGNAGDDVLTGGAGGDELEGGAGNDTLIGGANAAADQWGWARKDTARYNAPIDRFTIDTVTIDNQSWLRVTDSLPSDDSSSLGVDLLSGIEQLAFSDRWVGVEVRTSYWDDWQGGRNYNHEGTVFGDAITGGTTTTGDVTTHNRDFMRGGEGHDVLKGNGNGDELEGGLGNDVLDGGDNGTSGNSWQDQDIARFSGDSGQYSIQRFAVSGTSTSGILSVNGAQAATVANGALSFVSGLDTNVQDVITRAHDALDLFDGNHGAAWLIADSLDADLGGEGADLVFNVESINFRNGPLEIDIRVDANDWNGDGTLDWASVWGTGNADTVSLASIAELTGKSTSQLAATRIDIDLREGNDVYIGGDGGESIRTGMGHDYVDGGANTTTDQWGGQMRDEVRFEGRFSRYNLIDVTLNKSGDTWSLSNGKGLTVSGSAFTSVGIYSTLVLADLNAAVDRIIEHAGSNTSISAWLVADRLPAEFEGSGVDVVLNVEALAFNDKWMPLEMQTWYNRAWGSQYDNIAWESRPIVSAGVDGTSIGDTIGYSASRVTVNDFDTSSYNYTGDDNLRGNEGNDTILGGAGGDWIHGGEGDDSIDGGDNGTDEWGNPRFDTVQYDGDFDRYIITSNVDGSVTVADSEVEGDGIDTLTNVELIAFHDRWVRLGVETWVNRDPQTETIWDVQVNGSMLADTIDVSTDAYTGVRHFIRGNEGADLLIGGADPDEFEGGTGDDTLVGGANGKDAWGNPGFDVARYDGSEDRYTIEYSSDEGTTWSSTNPGGVGIWVKVTDSLSDADGGAGVDILQGIEALAFWDRFLMLEASRSVADLDGDGRPDKVELTGTDGADTLTGDLTNDDLKGAKGDDTLEGGAGGDILHGGAGNDSLVGGANGTDRDGRVLIDIALYDGNYADYTVDTVSGGGFTVTDSDTSSGGDGVDTLAGIEGIQFADRFIGLELMTRSKDTDKDGADDQIEIIGLDLASSGDTIALESGAEGKTYRIIGGLGNDTLTGGTADDVFEGGAGNDSINGGDGGYDRARFSGNYADYTLTTPTTQGGSFTVTHNNSGSDGVDTLVGIEELVFADRKFKVVASGQTAAVTTVDVDTDGNYKNDTRYVTGTDAADTITGASTLANIIDGGAGNDTLTGGNLGDVFKPGSGDDSIVGGGNTGLDAAGNASMDRVLYSGNRVETGGGYTIKSVQKAVFTFGGGVEAGDMLSVTVGSQTVNYTVTSDQTLEAAATAFASAVQTAVDTSTTVFTAASAMVSGAAQITLQGEDMIFAVTPTVTNGTQAVSGVSTTVDGASQTGSNLVVSSATGLAVGMYVAYSVTSGSGDSATTTTYGPYEITAISGTTLTLSESLSASPATGATLTVTQDNPNPNPTTVTAVTYDRWVEVGKSGETDTDTLRGIEQLAFDDGAYDLSFVTEQTATWGASGIVTVDAIIGTGLADLVQAAEGDELFTGGAGADHFLFADDNGDDSIADFVAGSGGDVFTLLLGADDSDGINGSGVDTIAELLAKGTQQGDDTVFDLGQGHSVTLTGVRLTDLVDANFEVVETF